MHSRFHTPHSAYVASEALAEVIAGLEGVKPASPSTLHALLAFVETCVIHSNVWFDYSHTLTPEFREHPLVTGLVDAGVLRHFPPTKDLDQHLRELGVGYDTVDLITDTHWTGASMQLPTGESEATLYRMKAWLLAEMPSLFEHRELLTLDGEPATREAAALINAGVPRDNIEAIESWNRRTQATTRLCRDLGLHCEMTPLDVPHQIGSIRSQNRLARTIYERLDAELKRAFALELQEQDLFIQAYPMIASTVLRATKGDKAALLDMLLAERARRSELRHYLEAFETRWAHTETLSGRSRLLAEVDNALAVLARRVGARQDRLIYRVWDVLKHPTEVLQSIGDRLVSVGRDHAVIGQVKGLRAFWVAASAAPAPDVFEGIVKRLMPATAPDAVWTAATQFSAALRQTI